MFCSELKRSLDQFVTKETAKLHDENAEEVIKKVKTGVVSAQSLIDRWNKAFTEVILLFCAQERERNYLFNDALNTFYLWLYGIRHMVKDHSDSEKGYPLPPHRLLLSINSKGSFICTIPQTG